MNSVVLIGRLARDPELRFIPGSGMAVANFILAIDKGYSKAKKEECVSSGKPTADFLRVKVWGKQAENCSQFLSKGKLAAIQGSINTSNYKDAEGTMRYITEINASRVEFLEWGEKKVPNESDDFSFGNLRFEDFQAIEDDDDVPF